MKILFLLYAPQAPFQDDKGNAMSGFPWSDTLIEELVKSQDISIALAVPVNGTDFQERREKGITLYGLPNPKETDLLKRIYQRIRHTEGNSTVNTFAQQAIAEFRPDIVQVFGSENPLGLIIDNQNIPFVIHIQGFLRVCLRKWFTGISKWDQIRYASIKDLLLMNGSYHEYYSFRKRAAREEIILKKCSYFMGRTAFDKQIVSLLSPGAKYFHCEEFIRKIFFEEKWCALPGDGINLVSILKATTYKGIDLLIDLLLILRRYPDLRFNLKICGVSENEEVVKILKKKYRKHYSSLNIEYKGRLSANELAAELCTSDLYIHPSYIENSPNSICEAMALGMPVISTNVGGVSSIIEDRVDGLLVQEGEPYSLAAAVMNLINNYEYAKLLGENARKRSFARHNPAGIVKELVNIYETILREHGRK
jgi:glycosyltransferase involved in cell wall biosynthesis